MPIPARAIYSCVIGLVLCGQTACNMVPRQALRQSQLRSVQLYQQNQSVMAERDQYSQMAQGMTQQLAQMESSLQTANQRLANLNSERSKLQDRYVSLLDKGKISNPLSERATRRLEELQKKYPDFEFDPHTGVSKFHSDILFSSGSDVINPKASPLLKDFAEILNDEDARTLNILVAGHTDDKRIIKRNTARKHQNNWYLSAHRAISVVDMLKKSGISETRMGVSGYSKYKPVVENTGKESRQLNRRVEIYVLAPDAVIAEWDPDTETSMN
jgi:chemotaxis protein MotB